MLVGPDASGCNVTWPLLFNGRDTAMSRLLILTVLALLAVVLASSTAQAKGFDETSGTFEFQLGPAVEVDGFLVISVQGEIDDLGGGPWTGTVSGSLIFTNSAKLCDYVGEWTIARENAAPLMERVKGTLTQFVFAEGPYLSGSSRTQSPDSGKIVGFRSFDGGISGSLDTFAGTWSGRFRVN